MLWPTKIPSISVSFDLKLQGIFRLQSSLSSSWPEIVNSLNYSSCYKADLQAFDVALRMCFEHGETSVFVRFLRFHCFVVSFLWQGS